MEAWEMKKPNQGSALYYASDKNIYDALNQSKVDSDTIQKMFSRRNIVVSKKNTREHLSRFFSRLTHDYIDHKEISTKLGIISRRERITSIDLIGPLTKDEIHRAIDQLQIDLEKDGDTVHITENNEKFTINVSYSVIDYKRSEFSQLQNKEGELEIIKEGEKYVIRSTQSEYINQIRDSLIVQLDKETTEPLKKISISLYAHKSPSVRSKFFTDLMTDLPGHHRHDVTDVYVYKPEPTSSLNQAEDDESHVEKVLMRGKGVTQSKILSELISIQNYYISRVGWVATEKLGKGYGFQIEAMFSEPSDCTGFSYLLRGIYELGEDGKLSKYRRQPTKSENDSISRLIEEKAKSLIQALTK